MTSSGTYNFGLDNGSLAVESFERLGIMPVELTRQHASDFPTPYPGDAGKSPCEFGLSTLAKVGIGVGVAAAVGGVALAVASAHGKKKRGASPPPTPPSEG